MTTRSKALAALRSGRVTVLGACYDPDTLTVIDVLASVASSRDPNRRYAIDYCFSGWACTCGADGCAHIAAVQLVTGHAPADLLRAAS